MTYSPAPASQPPPGTSAPGTNGYAIASLVLGIIGMGIGSILAVVFGHMALGQIRRTPQGGRGLAIAGLVLGYIGIAGIVILLLLFVVGGIGATATESG